VAGGGDLADTVRTEAVSVGLSRRPGGGGRAEHPAPDVEPRSGAALPGVVGARRRTAPVAGVVVGGQLTAHRPAELTRDVDGSGGQVDQVEHWPWTVSDRVLEAVSWVDELTEHPAADTRLHDRLPHVRDVRWGKIHLTSG